MGWPWTLEWPAFAWHEAEAVDAGARLGAVLLRGLGVVCLALLEEPTPRAEGER